MKKKDKSAEQVTTDFGIQLQELEQQRQEAINETMALLAVIAKHEAIARPLGFTILEADFHSISLCEARRNSWKYQFQAGPIAAFREHLTLKTLDRVDFYHLLVLRTILQKIKTIRGLHVQANQEFDEMRRDLHELTRPKLAEGE